MLITLWKYPHVADFLLLTLFGYNYKAQHYGKHIYICIWLTSYSKLANILQLSLTVLLQLHGKLKEKMVNEDLNLTWTKAPDGEIFHNTRKDEKQQHPEVADERCPPKVDQPSFDDNSQLAPCSRATSSTNPNLGPALY